MVKVATGAPGKGGAAQYGLHNWAKGLAASRLYNSLIRHAEARRLGEMYDPTTGLLHSAHVMWNAMALCHNDILEYRHLDDLTWGPSNGSFILPRTDLGNSDNRSSTPMRRSRVSQKHPRSRK